MNFDVNGEKHDFMKIELSHTRELDRSKTAHENTKADMEALRNDSRSAHEASTKELESQNAVIDTL